MIKVEKLSETQIQMLLTDFPEVGKHWLLHGELPDYYGVK